MKSEYIIILLLILNLGFLIYLSVKKYKQSENYNNPDSSTELDNALNRYNNNSPSSYSDLNIDKKAEGDAIEVAIKQSMQEKCITDS